MAVLTLEPPNSFEPKTPGLGIQHLNHQTTVRLDLPISFLYMRKHCSISVIHSQSNRFIFWKSIFHSPSYMKCYYSFQTIKQNKIQLVSNSCGCLILLVQKILAKQCGFIQLVSFNACTFISYLNVWSFIFNVMLFREHHQSMFDGMTNMDNFRTVQWNSSRPHFHLKIDFFKFMYRSNSLLEIV